MASETRREIGRLLTRRCTNCFHKLPGFNTSAWHWITPNVGPFCTECWAHVEPRLKPIEPVSWGGDRLERD